MSKILPKRFPAGIGLVGIFLLATLVAAGTGWIFIVGAEGDPQVTTDKPDYYSNETVIITGTGFAANTYYDVPVLRPDGSYVKGDGSFQPGWDWVLTDGSGGFTYYYKLDGIPGTYWVAVHNWPWAGPGSPEVPLATTSFTDADIHFSQCENKDPGPDCEWTTGAINTTNSTYYEGDSVPQRLFHKVQDVGSHTMRFSYEFSKADVYAFDFATNVDQTLGVNLDPCDDLPGFVTPATCNSLYAATALVPVPSDPFDLVSTRENPPGSGARNFRVACTPACTGVSVNIVGHDPSTTCFRNCGSSEAQIEVNFTTASAKTLVSVWFAGHLAEATDPDGGGPVEGWGTGCNGSGSCGSSAIAGAPFHLKYISLDGGSVGNRDNQIQSGGVQPPPPPGHLNRCQARGERRRHGRGRHLHHERHRHSPRPPPSSARNRPAPPSVWTPAPGVSETGPPGYSVSYSADCSALHPRGETKTCTVNDDIARSSSSSSTSSTTTAAPPRRPTSP
jgi:hypothetical protein